MKALPLNPKRLRPTIAKSKPRTANHVLILLLGLIPLLLFAVDPRYHTYGEMADELRFIALRYPNITRLYTIGITTGFQLPILAMKISDNPQFKEDEPRLLYNGLHHAAEVIGPEICLSLINDLVTKYGTDSFITAAINSSEIWIVPMVNPDGNYIVHSGIDTMWRKNCRDNNSNGIFDSGDGVDLNRNYDFLWHLGGSTVPTNREYRGPYPFSEGETQAIRNLALREKFVFDICYHSSKESWEGEAVYYPWRWGNPFSPDHRHIKSIAESIAYRIRNDAGNGTYYAIFGQAEGGLARNWLYYALGTFAYTIEVSRGYFPPGYRVDSICQRNLPGAYYLLQRVLGSQITGHITDSVTNYPLVAEVKILEAYAPSETIAPRMSDSLYGRFYRILSPGNYTLKVTKPGYETESIPNISVIAGQPTYLNIKLKPVKTLEENQFINIAQLENLQVLPSVSQRANIIKFTLNYETKVDLKIYSENGKLIRTLTDQTFLPGTYTFHWDYQDQSKKKASSGVYFVRLTTDKSVQTKKFLVLDKD